MLNFTKLISAIILCQGAGIIGAIFTTPNIQMWYAQLNKPSFNPPNWIFAPVWTTLYLLMGISLFLIWQTKDKQEARKQGLMFFFLQLVLNTVWSIVFFGMHSLVGGLIIIVFLWIMILLTIINFQKVKKLAAYLLYPYLAWVSLATILNFSLVILNR